MYQAFNFKTEKRQHKGLVEQTLSKLYTWQSSIKDLGNTFKILQLQNDYVFSRCMFWTLGWRGAGEYQLVSWWPGKPKWVLWVNWECPSVGYSIITSGRAYCAFRGISVTLSQNGPCFHDYIFPRIHCGSMDQEPWSEGLRCLSEWQLQVGCSWHVLFGQEGCSQSCHTSKNLGVGEVWVEHGEGLLTGLRNVLANYQTTTERECRAQPSLRRASRANC